jgi:hypothetical protein
MLPTNGVGFRHIAAIPIVAIVLFAAMVAPAWTEPVLVLNEPRDTFMAKDACEKAASFKTSPSFIDINATCTVSGPVAAVREFHAKLLTLFATNPQCRITIMQNDDLKRGNWELNLGFKPGAAKQYWAMWPMQDGKTLPNWLEGEGNASQIVHDVCAIMTRSGAKILN